jgi:Tn3 transposase DDE domain/Glutathione-dependent formaldehyde-activating enzyme
MPIVELIRDCQQASGSAYAAIVAVPKAAVQIRGELRYHKIVGQTGRFCPSCGSQMTVKLERRLRLLPAARVPAVPSLKAIGKPKLYRPDIGQPEAYPNLQPVLTKPIDWELIRQRYDQMVKYTTALRLGRQRPRPSCAASPATTMFSFRPTRRCRTPLRRPGRGYADHAHTAEAW